MNKDIIRFIDKLYKDLYKSDTVLHHSTGPETDKYRNIDEYMLNLERIHERASKSEERIKTLKRLYFDKYVIKRDDIPQSYYDNQARIALERGFGHIEIGNEQKEKLQDEVINNQKRSMEEWLDYFLSEDSKFYPFWAKYWAFQGMIKLGTYDKEKGSFNKRTKETTAPFADLNREALSKSIDLIINFLNKEDIGDNELEAIVRTGSFQKIYPYVLTKVLSNNENIIKRNEGKWVKYNRGSDPMPLVKSLQGYNTGWCTAGESTAREQLSAGDFYVYYTLDENGEYKVPRVAIRMEDDNIGEIRGIGESQNIESDMEKVVEDKIKDFPDKDKYYKKVNDMKMLTELYNKKDKELSIEELRFLYEIDDSIKGFGYRKDPRIEEIKNERNVKRDLSKVFDCREDQISLEGEKYSSDTVYYYGSLYFVRTTSTEGLSLPQRISGNLMLRKIESMEGVKLPKIVGGYLDLSGLIKAEGLELPQSVGTIDLRSLKTAKGLKFPDRIDGELNLHGLETAEGLNLPHEVHGELNLSNLKKIKGLVFPQWIGGHLLLEELETAEDIVIPYVGGDIYLSKLVTAKNIRFPQNLNLSLYMGKLRTGENIVLPQNIGGRLNLDSLSSAEGLKFPENVGHQLYLKSLTTSKGLVLPKSIGGWLELNNLRKVEELELPLNVGGGINLYSLKTANRLILPKSVGTYICFDNLASFDGIIFPDKLTYTLLTKFGQINKNNIDEFRNENNIGIKK